MKDPKTETQPETQPQADATKPFFARFLQGQFKSGLRAGRISNSRPNQTLKYPSDGDEG